MGIAFHGLPGKFATIVRRVWYLRAQQESSRLPALANLGLGDPRGWNRRGSRSTGENTKDPRKTSAVIGSSGKRHGTHMKSERDQHEHRVLSNSESTAVNGRNRLSCDPNGLSCNS